MLVGAVLLYGFIQELSEDNVGRQLAEEGCVEPADPRSFAFLYALGVLYLFVALAIVAGNDHFQSFTITAIFIFIF